MNGCLQAIAILFGIFLLLPGACSVIFFFMAPGGVMPGSTEPVVFMIWFGGLILGAGGIFILIKTLRAPPGR
jgi:hypothetical protein